MFCVSGIFRNHSSFRRRAEERDTKGHPAVGAWEATDRQEAGDTTGRERFEDSASV